MRSRFGAVVAAAAILALVAAACGGGSGASGSATSRSASRPASCAGTGSVAHPDLRYRSTAGVAAALQSLDLFLPVRPAGCPRAPIVVYIHGGGFQVGDKANKPVDKVNLFTHEGWAFASVNYRLVGNPGSGAPGGRYPAPEEDIAAAVAYLAGHASRYDLDARHIMLLGHSAGAHLVALVSTDGSFLEDAGVPLDDVVCTAPLDTTYDIPTQVAHGGPNAKMYTTAFGVDPTIWIKGSPTRNVARGKGIPSFHVVARGSPSRVEQAESFGEVLRRVGVAADVQDVRGLTHEQVNAAVGQPGESVITSALMAFYRSCATR